MTKKAKIEAFNPSAVGQKNAGIYGFPFTAQESDYVIVPVPWQATVSFNPGTAQAPEAILEASSQLDFYFPDFPDVWKKGIAMLEIPSNIALLSEQTRILVDEHIFALENGKPINAEVLDQINLACYKCHQWVNETTQYWLSEGKKVILLGGDHSTPLAYMQTLAQEQSFGILLIDAHLDLRDAYEDFTYSHASVMFNALKSENINQIAAVGTRDYAQEEVDFINNTNKSVTLFSNQAIQSAMLEGQTWQNICQNIIEVLPSKVYLSIDIDGLDPSLCPTTGTPVPGGLSYDQLIYLLKKLADSGKEIIGMDLVEVGKDPWDANVAARVLYNMIGYWDRSNK